MRSDNPVPLKIEPGLILDDTSFKVRQGGYKDINNVRVHDGELEVIGGWERFVYTQVLTGKCRGVHSWRDDDGEINFAFGTHSNLYVWKGGKLYDITPVDFVAGNENGFGGGGHGVGAWNAGGYGIATEGIYYPQTWTLDNREGWLIANPRGGKIYAWKNDTSTPAVELAPRQTRFLSDFTAHVDEPAFDGTGWTRGTGWTFDAAGDEVDCDGSQTADSDLERTLTNLTVGKRYRVALTYTRTAGTIAAVGHTTAGDTQSDASGTAQVIFLASSTTHTVMARADADFVGSISDFTVEQMGAPEFVETILVASTGQICAYGCEEELDLVQNPRCVRWCDTETSLTQGFDDWTGSPRNNAGQEVLRNAGRIIRAVEMGQIIAVFTDEGVFWQTFRGLPDKTWDFNRAGRNCGLIGPNAVAVLGTQAFWCGTDFVFYTLTYGGQPVALPAPLDNAFKDLQVHAQQEKIYCSTISSFNEIWFFYPDNRDDTDECSRYVALAAREGQAGKWFAGIMDRTAFLDSAPYEFPVAVDKDGRIYLHERGDTAAGNAISWHAETGDIYLNDSSRVVQIRGMRPDFHNQGGPINLQLTTRRYAQSKSTDDDYVTKSVVLTAGQKKSDFRISGAILNLKFSSDSLGARARFGKHLYDIAPRGQR